MNKAIAAITAILWVSGGAASAAPVANLSAVEGSLSGQPPLRVVTSGGSYTRSQMRAIIKPYRASTGAWISVEEHPENSMAELRSQVESENVVWDVVNMNLPNTLRACRAGLLERIGSNRISDAPDGTPATEDFYPAMLHECGVGHSIFSTVVAFDPTALDGVPTKIADFFDTGRFPGARGLERNPRVALEWALLADGVSPDELYKRLSTESGLRRAFRKLDSIRDKVVWWVNGEEPAQLLEQGRVSMTSAFNGRIHIAQTRGASIQILWKRQVWNFDLWVVPRGSQRLEEAFRFIDFATRTDALVRQTSEITYGPARKSAVKKIPKELEADFPTAAAHATSRIQLDVDWWAKNGDRVEARFEKWLARGPVFDFDRPGRE